jgi:ABC-type transport system involved in multi-copper enzyme maturation permease subunit
VVHVVGPNATIASGATVSVDGEANATNRLGICTFEGLSKGNHTVTATLDGSASGLTIVKVSRERTEVDPFALASADPDMVIAIIASIAMGIFGPIYAIVLCFDSVFREKLTGHIDYLLSRPMGRRAVISGKFLGILAALMVPITVVSLVGIAIINAESPTSASLSVVAGFLVYSTLLIAFFALLQMIFSTLAKTTGTAVLSGVGIWLMFSMLFSIIMVVVAILKGMELGSSEFNEWYTRVSLINPIDVYSHAISVAAGNNMGAGLPNWLPGTILVVLALVMLVLTSEVFRRRVTE